jgi:3',5'-cyclic AMP phosphodiesterase CpdA
MRLLHLSDPHFGTEVPLAVHALRRLAHESAPDVLVLSGDITQRARRAQFDAARRFVDELGIAVRVVIPGNHDIPLFDLCTRAFDPYRGYRRAFGAELEPRIEREDLLLLAVRTTRRRRHKHGEVSAAQVASVEAALRRATSRQLRVVVVHQPMQVPRPEDEHNLLRGADAAARAWAAAGADLVLGGHIHLPYVLPMSSRYAGLTRELWCVQAGTAVSARVRREAPHSVNLIDYAPDVDAAICHVTRWDLAPGAERFAPTSETRIALQR